MNVMMVSEKFIVHYQTNCIESEGKKKTINTIIGRNKSIERNIEASIIIANIWLLGIIKYLIDI